jgi:hypothetical protein
LIFQILDDKQICPAIYVNGEILLDNYPEDLSKTWRYSSYLKDLDVEYAQLYCDNKTLDEVCPEDFKARWSKVSSKLKAFLRSFQEAKIDLNQNCFFDLVPQSFLLEFCEIKNDITNHVLQNFLRPKNYRFLLSLTKLVEDIKYRKLNIDHSVLEKNMASYRIRQLKKKIETNRSISYNIHGTKTGRLTTHRDSFPILTLDKNFRSILRPNNDWFVELDFNAAEVRTFLALLGEPQPENDIHAWLGKVAFKGKFDRDLVKKNVFAWLYNPVAENDYLDKIFDKNKAVLSHYTGGLVENPYGRKIESDDHHALNYLIQSTTSDILLRRMVSLAEMLRGRKTYVAFSIHDSVVLDFCDQDRDIFMELVNEFSNTELGNFKANVSVGKDFGNMRNLVI